MIDEVVACLDGSAYAESVLPYARGIAMSGGASLTLLNVIESDSAELTTRKYLDPLADRLCAKGKIKRAPAGAADGILEDLRQNPNSLPVLTTHGRTGLLETLFGSVALAVIRGAGRPVLVYRPQSVAAVSDETRQIRNVIAALDGFGFSEKILPFAAAFARQLNAGLQFLQVLAESLPGGGDVSHSRGDILESSYLQRKARETEDHWGIAADWDVLHGSPGTAICAYLTGRPDSLLAMTSHARAGLERTFFGSVSAECLRRVGVPILIYWPN